MLLHRLLLLVVLLSLLSLSAAMAQQPVTADDILRLAKAGDAADHDFSGVRAPGLSLQGASLIAAKLPDADLRGARFSSVSLEQANLRGANLRGAIFERVNLLGADLTGADLSGGTFILTNLENAQLTGARLDGALFEGTSLSQTGAPYLVALHIALEQATGRRPAAAMKVDEATAVLSETKPAAGEALSRAWVAGMSGDAFAFAYNERNTASWPGVPFVANPLLAAATNMGLIGSFHRGAEAEKVLFDEDRNQPRATFMIALKLPEVDARLTQDRPLWGLLTAREVRDDMHYYTFAIPPFGSHEFRRDALLDKAWLGPWETPEPAGAMFASHRQLARILMGVPAPISDQARLAIKQAVAIITDKRTYGPLTPGEAGLMKLASDLRAVAEGLDADKARQMAPWQLFPRNCLIGSLELATQFLSEAAPALPQDQAASCQEARLALRSAMTDLDAHWPLLSAGTDRMSQEQANAFAKAADIIAGVAAAERKTATLLATVGG
jgi:uncharacterized protein YjbI with pentapeptide repeats